MCDWRDLCDVSVCSCPVLLMTGQRSAFNSATRAMHQTILRSCDDKAKVEFIEVAGVANLLQEKVHSLLLSLF